MKQIKVLIVDDHKLMREGIRELLEGEKDIQVVGEATNGAEAVERTAELLPDVVLMDINMPEMNGIEATKLIKSQLADVKILILTMYDYEDYILETFKAGALGYVLKKGGKQDLLFAIKTVYNGETFLFPSVAGKVVSRATQITKNEGAGAEALLTEREKEILSHVATGRSNQEIASSLNLSIRTVETHRANIMRKISSHNTADLVRYAIAKGLIQADHG